MEFRILTRISFHKDHANNLLRSDLQQFKDMNRHLQALPFKHNRVKIECMQQHNMFRLSQIIANKIDPANSLQLTKSISESRPQIIKTKSD